LFLLLTLEICYSLRRKSPGRHLRIRSMGNPYIVLSLTVLTPLIGTGFQAILDVMTLFHNKSGPFATRFFFVLLLLFPVMTSGPRLHFETAPNLFISPVCLGFQNCRKLIFFLCLFFEKVLKITQTRKFAAYDKANHSQSCP